MKKFFGIVALTSVITPINSPSDRVMQSNQSFQLNRGLGNVRYHLNN